MASSVELDISARRWSPKSLFRKAIHHQLSVWKLSPPSTNDVYSLAQAIGLVSDRSFGLLNREPEMLSREDAADLLQMIREEFMGLGYSIAKFEHVYYAMRKLLTRTPTKLNDGLTFAQAASKQKKPPKLPLAQLPAELGHINHTDLKDLRNQTEKKLQTRKDRLEEAVASELRAYENTFAFQDKLLSSTVGPEVHAEILAWILAPKRDDLLTFPQCTPTEFTTVLLRFLQSRKPPFCPSGFVPDVRLPRTKINWSEVPNVSAYRFKSSVLPWFFVRHRLPNSVLTAIFALILSHTGWNPGSVGELIVTGISCLPKGGYRLQSYKSKTDDQTPVVEVPRHMKVLCKAIELLLWNRQQLGQLGLIDLKKEKRLWFGWQDDNFQMTIDFLNSSRIKAFCNRYGLEIFLPSELRPLKAALTYIPQGDLEAVRVLLGHNDLKTSDDYLQNTLFFRLNEAMILEFQRRIETTITYVQGGESLIVKRSLSSNHIDGKLFLIPTGDGGACANVFDGPTSTRVETGEPCEALACHSGQGCPHYRTLVSEITLEMALRSLRYYRARWQSLFEKNRLGFSELHLPKIIYIHVLLRIVSERRPDLYLKAERTLTPC